MKKYMLNSAEKVKYLNLHMNSWAWFEIFQRPENCKNWQGASIGHSQGLNEPAESR